MKGLFSAQEKSKWWQLKEQQQELEGGIQEVADRLVDEDWGTDEKWWGIIGPFLEEEYGTDVSNQFEVGADEGGLAPNHFWQKWCQGGDRRPGIWSSEDPGGPALWSLSLAERLERRGQWFSRLYIYSPWRIGIGVGGEH